MPLRISEAFVLRTYALKESDKIVSFFTREFGKRRGVARAARRPKSKFGAMLEPLAQVHITYFEREGRDLCIIDSAELVQSMVASASTSLLHSVALACMVEVAERLLPEHEPNDPVFRLLASTLAAMRTHGSDQLASTDAQVWLALTYFLYWMVRLSGFLPDFTLCCSCGQSFDAKDTVRFDTLHPGLLCRQCSTGGALLVPSARELAIAMQRTPLADFVSVSAGADLRRFLRERIEDHIEAKLQSWKLLSGLEEAI